MKHSLLTLFVGLFIISIPAIAKAFFFPEPSVSTITMSDWSHSRPSSYTQNNTSVQEETKSEPKTDTLPLLGIVLVLDAGHGGADRGAFANGLREKDLNLAITEQTAIALRSLGATVELTRAEDITLERRTRYTLPAQTQASYFISIHANSGDAQARGIETYYYHPQDASFAQSIHTQLIANTQSNDRKVRFGDYYVLRENTVPSVLIETGFMTNQEDARLLVNERFQNQIATAIAEGVRLYVQ